MPSGGLGWVMLECVIVCRVTLRILSFGGGGIPKFGVDGRKYIAQTTRGIWGHAPPFFFF